MIKKSKIRETITNEIIKATGRLYSIENYKRWGNNKIYPHQIEDTWKRAYKTLASKYPRRKWLKLISNTSGKDISLKLILRVPDKDIEIRLPDSDSKFGAIAHAGGNKMLLELLQIIQNFGYENESV